MEHTVLDTARFNIPAGTIDLSIGQPAMDLLPHAFIRRAAEDFLTHKDVFFAIWNYAGR
ncbi:MAG: hypothetical protein JW822_12890 [Spirochaetales bacterium]|nr:hypothetical protein [Spirochaetales bacterium]